VAIVSAIALFVALGGTVLLLVLQLLATDSVPPALSVAPGLGVALGDSVAVASPPPGEVAAAHVAGGGHPALVATSPVADEGDEGGAAGTVPAIAPARAVAHREPASPPPAAAEPSPQPQPQPQAPPPATLVPVAVSAPTAGSPAQPPPAQTETGLGGGMQGPIGSGVEPPGEAPGEGFTVCQGDEEKLSFSFSSQSTAYREPGTENLIVRFGGEASEPPTLGLQLWDDGGGSRGLWSSGEERLLAPVEDAVAHQVTVDFLASSEADGYYLVVLDGRPIDAAAGVGLIAPDSVCARVEVGLFRDGEPVPEAGEVEFGPASLAPLEPLLP
jgi:hypothetical protein